MSPGFSPPKPTAAELALLRVLWRRGPSTVREVLETLDPDTGYTTVLKLLQIMTEKGLVERDEARKSHVYRAALDEARTQCQLVDDLVNRAFDGSAARLVLHALSTSPASAEDLAAIRQLLDRIEGGAR